MTRLDGATQSAILVHRRTRKADHRRFPFTQPPAPALESVVSQRKQAWRRPVPLGRKESGPVKLAGFKASGEQGLQGRRTLRTPEPDRCNR